MKKTFIISLITLLACSALNAQNPGAGAITVSDVKVNVVNDYVNVSFLASVASNAAKSSYTLFATPVLTSGNTRQQLPPIVVQGKRARTAEKRYSMSKQYTGVEGQAIYTSNGQQVEYKISIPYQAWMNNAQLLLEKHTRGCCSDMALPFDLLAQNLSLMTTPVVVAEAPKDTVKQEPVKTQPIRVVPQAPQTTTTVVKEYMVVGEPQPVDESGMSTADKLARHFAFIAPISDFEKARKKTTTGNLFDYNMPLNLGRGITRAQQHDLDQFINDNRDDALSIYFKQGSYVIYRDFADNGYALVDIISSIRAIQASDDSRIVRIIIGGFASPEGSFMFNDRLAWERAVAVKEFILNNTNISSRMVNIYNGSVDWRGLYSLVAESDMYHKYQILNIIDLAPVWGDAHHLGRLDELKRLNGGEPYKYMLQNLFPLLRNAAYIKVYYQNKQKPVVQEQIIDEYYIEKTIIEQ